MSSRRKGGGKRAVSAAVTAIMADRDIEEQFRTIDSATKSVRKADADPIPAHDQPDAPGALNPNAIEPKAALAQASEALSDNGVDSSESSSAPHSTASARYKRQTRRGVVTSSYDDSPQQPDKQPTFPATLDIKIDARSALEAWAHSSHQAAEPQQSPDVPFLPPPKAITRQKEGAERHTLEPLEMPSTLAVSAACDVAAQPAPASSGNTDSHIRSKAGKIFAEKGVHAVSAGPEASSGQRVAPITQFSTRTAAVHRKDRDGVAPLPSSAGGGPVPTYHRALPKAGSKEYEAFEKHVRTKFDHYDKDKHGVLNEQDAMALAVDLHKEFKPKSARLSDADAKADALKLMRRIDKNADNLIEFDEFLPWYTSMLDQIHGFVDSHTDPASPVPFSAHTPVQPGIAVLSPEQERQSKRNVEDALSRLERRAPDHTEGAGNTAEGEGFLPVTQYSTRGSTPSMRKTPITQFSARGARTPATGLGSLYSPRHRAWQVRDAKLAQGVEKSRHGGETSAQMSTTAGALSVPPCSDEDREVGLERWVGSRPPSVISVASAASSTDAKITAKRRELRHAMSSDDDDSASAAEMHTGRQALEYTREPGWESASDDQYQGMAVPPSGIRKMAIRRRDLSKQQSRLAADGKHHHRETSRRANGVSHAMRREWASQILGELKGRFDYMHRGQKPYFIEWKFRTEVSNVHYQLLALKIRRYNRGLLHRFMLSWHADAHDKACDRRLCLREERKFRSRLFKAYFQNWKLYTGRIRRHAGILYRALWREVSYFFKVWAKDVEQVLWMRDRLWQLRQRRCARALRLCLTGMRDVVKSRQHMQLFSDVLCRDLLTETVVFLHAWRDLVRELNFLHTRARRCKSRWRSFEYYSHFHAWWFTMVTEQASRAKVRRADIHMTESTLLKFHCGWLQAIDRMRYLTHAGAGIFERHERLLLKAAFAEMNFISMSNDSLRKVRCFKVSSSCTHTKRVLLPHRPTLIATADTATRFAQALTALLEKHINRLIIGVFRAWFAMIYDVRMKFRSRMFKRHLSHKALCSIMQAWHARHVFWRRMERKFRVLRVKYTLEMQRAILHAWRGTAKTCSDRAKKVELTQRLHLARLCTQAFQCWQRWTKTYVTRIIAVAGWAISRQDLRCISMCLKRWKHEMEREASLAVKGRRVETTSRARACHRCVKVWKAAVARNMRRSVGRLSEHLTWALCCVLSELLRMSRFTYLSFARFLSRQNSKGRGVESIDASFCHPWIFGSFNICASAGW